MDHPYPEASLIGKSEAFNRIQNLIARVKDLDAPVFISGESGTGKELIARAIHSRGIRCRGRFVAVNCGAIPEQLLESELFGYARGAFTGALRDKVGLIEEADAGTFFLDEVGDLSLQLQAKLLRLLQEKEIRRIGENRVRSVDTRFISATNKDIEKEVESGRFREDLDYRLRIITIEIPPLRERKDDLIVLMEYFIEKYSREIRGQRISFSSRVQELFLNYQWPGNIRELQNEIQRCIILSGEERVVREEHVSTKINPRPEPIPVSPYNFFEAKAEFVRSFLSQALLRANFNRARAAEEIGLSRQGLFKLMKKYKIEVSPDSKN